MIPLTDTLFTKVEKPCPSCQKSTVNQLNDMMICESCGWYLIITDNRKPIAEFMLCDKKPIKINKMNPEFKKTLLEARAILETDIAQLNEKLNAINKLIGHYQPPIKQGMSRGIERRRGGVKHCLLALEALGSGTIKDISHKVQEMNYIPEEGNIYSKVATYMKRLHEGGVVTCTHANDSYKSKIYSLMNNQ